MKGTEKQVAWAEAMVNGYVRMMGEEIARITKKIEAGRMVASYTAQKAELEEHVEIVKSCDDAAAIIHIMKDYSKTLTNEKNGFSSIEFSQEKIAHKVARFMKGYPLELV